MTPAERDDALQMVEEIQQERSSRALELKAADVPAILLPYQVQWHLDEAQTRICRKGRRVGFTWGAWAAEAALEAARKTGGMNQFYMGYNQGMAAEFIGDCATFAKWYGFICSQIDVAFEGVVIDNEKRDIVRYKITMSNGRKIEALSSMPHNWRGRQGHARIDEAGHHHNLGNVIEGALAYRIWGGRVSIGGTLNGEDNEFTELCKRVEDGRLGWSLHNVTFSDAVRQGLYKRICLITKKVWSAEGEREWIEKIRSEYADQESADQELECIAKRGSGAYFSRLLVEHAARKGVQVIKHKRPAEFVTDPGRIKKTQQWLDDVVGPSLERLDKARRHTYSQDFSRSADGDLSAITILSDRAFGLGWDTALSIELRGLPYDCQGLIRDYVIDRLPRFKRGVFDANGNGNSHAEAALQKYGSDRIEAVMVSSAIHDTWWPKLRQAYEDGDLTIEHDEDVFADHRSVQLVNGCPRVSGSRRRGSDGGMRHGDAAFAKLLGLMAALADRIVVPAGESVESRGEEYQPQGRPGGMLGRMFGRIRGAGSLWGARERATGTDEGQKVDQGTPGHALDSKSTDRGA